MLDQLLSEQYEKDNYKVEDISPTKKCCIFCSSNGLWDYSETSFYQKVICQDTYEWQNIAKHKKIRKYFGRIIFVRDIRLHFYVDGINKRIHSIDQLIDLLKDLTDGYEATVIGCSSGAYLAMILSNALCCCRCFSLCGQFNLYKWSGGNNKLRFKDFEYLEKRQNDETVSKYYDVRPFIEKSNGSIFHFYAGLNDADNIQIKSALDIPNVYFFPMNEKTHGGSVIYGFNIPYLLTQNPSRLIKVSRHFQGKMISKFSFSCKIAGCLLTVFTLFKKTIKKFLRKA